MRAGLLREVRLLGALLAGYGLASMLAIALARRGKETNMLSSIVGDFAGMPPLMKRLALVQFFSWSALFIMWINTTPIVARYHYGARSEEHTSELQSLMRISYAVFCLKKQNTKNVNTSLISRLSSTS